MRIAAVNASAAEKSAADVTCSGASDQVTILAAINAPGASNVVELSSGDFHFSGKLLLSRPGLVFFGQGRQTTIHRVPPHAAQLIQCATNGRLVGVELRDLAFDDAGAALHALGLGDTSTVQAYNAENVKFSRLYLSDIYRTGIFAANSDDVIIEDCETKDARGIKSPSGFGGDGGIGIKLFSGTYTDPTAIPSRNNVVRNCEVSGSWRVGIWSTGVQGLTYQGNLVYNNHPQIAKDNGIERGGQLGVGSGCTGIKILDNDTYGGVESIGIELDVVNFGSPNSVPIHDALIAGNRIYNQGLSGILIVSDAAATIPDCELVIEHNLIMLASMLKNPGWGSIQVTERIRGFTIRENMVTETRNPACLIRKGATDYVITGNHFATSGAPLMDIRSALQDDGIGIKSVAGNLCLVNGKVFA